MAPPKESLLQQARALSRRNFLRLSGIAFTASALTACVAPTAPTASTGSSESNALATEPATVEFLGGPWSFLPELDVVIDSFAAKWGPENNATVTFERDATVLPKIQTAIETGSGASIIQYSQAPQIFKNALADVTDIAEELDAEGGGFLPNAPFNLVNDGKWLGLPLGQHNWFINYRQDWLQEEGYETFPDTWEEALELGRILKAKERPYGMPFSDLAAGDGNAVPRMILWAFGGKEFNEDGSIALDSQETMDALEFAISLHNDAGDPGETAWDDGANNASFLAGTISMTANVNTIYLPAKANNPEIAEAMNHALPPAGPGGRFSAGTLPWWGLLKHTQGANLEASQNFMRAFLAMESLGDSIRQVKAISCPSYRTMKTNRFGPKIPNSPSPRRCSNSPCPQAMRYPTKLPFPG